MAYLLDTHAVLWFFSSDKKLSNKAKDIIENREYKIFISIASFWEIAIKVNKGNLKINSTFNELKRQAIDNGFIILPITFENTAIVSSLPQHHNDPFDRIIIAQAMDEKMTIISKDENFSRYAVKVIWD